MKNWKGNYILTRRFHVTKTLPNSPSLTAHECRAAINDGAGAWLGVSRAALPHPCADVIWAGGGLLSLFSLTIHTHPEASSCPKLLQAQYLL